jgi:hypothetical protein
VIVEVRDFFGQRDSHDPAVERFDVMAGAVI